MRTPAATSKEHNKMTLGSYTLPNPYSVGSTDYLAGINFERMRSERLRKAQAALRRYNMAQLCSCGPKICVTPLR
jgi:hypothetical protein